MKKILLLAGVLCFAFSSCKKNEEPIVKTCIVGYEGKFCDIENREKFVGDFNAIQTSPNNISYICKSVTDNTNVLKMYFINILNDNDTVSAIVQTDNVSNFTILPQTVKNKATSGNGFINDNIVSVNISYGGIDYNINMSK